MCDVDLSKASFDVEQLNIEKDKNYIIYLNVTSGVDKQWCGYALKELKRTLVERGVDVNNIIYTLKSDGKPLFEIKECEIKECKIKEE